MAGQLGVLILRRLGVCLLALTLLAPPALGRPPAPTREVVVQFDATVSAAARRAAVRAAGGSVTRDLHVIHALGARVSAAAAGRLRHAAGVRGVTPSAPVQSAKGRFADWNPSALATAFVQSTRADKAWTDPQTPATGADVAVAVVDSGIAGDLPDFRDPASGASRVIASVVTNPDATTASDAFGHGTHVAGLIAGNGRALAPSDPLYNRYIGTAPDAKLVSVKVSDDHGDATTIDVIAGLQFVVDHGAEYGIRVVNLSLGSTVAESYQLDPLDAAVEAVWMHGIVVVAAAGNRGADAGAVSYAPANDPYVISVGAVDDAGTKQTADDTLPPWSSRGVTQDGFAKPEVVAPGAHIGAPLAPGSDYASMCPGCVVGAGRYFVVGGTSMAAPIVAGIAADLIAAHPAWTPSQVKGALAFTSEKVRPSGKPVSNGRPTADGSWEVAADKALNASKKELVSDQGLLPSPYLDASGAIDPARAPFGRASWRAATGALQASWGAPSWACGCQLVSGDPAGTSRASWRRASWRTFFGAAPGE